MSNLNKKRVVVVDDNDISLMHMEMLLKRMGYAVIPAENGLKVLKLLKITKPDVIMLDIGMETVDGVTVLKRVKEDEQTSDIPVIMVSGDSSSETIEKCKRLGCTDYLTKPVIIDKLHAALEKCNFSTRGTARKHFRTPANKRVIVTHNGVSHDLYTETISEGGAYIRKKDPFQTGEKVEVTFPLAEGKSLRLSGVVVHAKGLFDDAFDAPAGMGIRFEDLTDNEARALRDYIEQQIVSGLPDDREA